MKPLLYSLLSGVVSLAAPLSAQSLLQRFDGTSANEAAGRCVASAGDVNGDGFDDVLIGVDWFDGVAQDSGEVYVLDGQALAGGRVVRLHTFLGNSIGDFFGWSTASAGDVNGDGFADIVVGAYGDDPANTLDAGSAYVYDGRTGGLLYEFNGSSQFGVNAEARFGYDVSGAGDVNGDGYDDVIVGAYTANVGTFSAAGSATVFSGRDGSVLFTFEGSANQQYVGFSVSGAGDVDGDGHDDVIVGAVGDSTIGAFGGAAVILSYDAAQPNFYRVVRRYDASAAGDLQGACVGNAGDVDGDFVPDQIVGAAFGDPNGLPNHGSATVYSGSNGAVLHQFAGLTVFGLYGISAAGAGDVDGDGHADLIVGAALDSSMVPFAGAAFVYSGATGQLLATFGGQTPADAFGWTVSSAGDIDDDGYDELLVGAPFADPNGLTSGGSAFLYDDIRSVLDPARTHELGAACPHVDGRLPTITVAGRAAFGGMLQIGLRGTLPSNTVILNLAAPFTPPIALGSLGFGSTCTAYVKTDGFIVYSTSNALGVATKSAISIPNAPQFLGASIYAQWICQDLGAPGQHVFSDALQLTLGN